MLLHYMYVIWISKGLLLAGSKSPDLKHRLPSDIQLNTGIKKSVAYSKDIKSIYLRSWKSSNRTWQDQTCSHLGCQILFRILQQKRGFQSFHTFNNI